MKKLLVFWGICFFVLSGSAWAQPNYLIKIDQINQVTMDQIKKTEIEVWGKTTDFWIAGASKKDLELLTKEGITFEILDQEAEIGEYYFVWSKPSERMELHLPTIKTKSQVLLIEGDMALVKGDPKKIEQLPLLGFSLKKIHKKSLPLESKGYIPSYLESLSTAYDPLIDSIVHKVNQTQLLSWIDDLSGEDTVSIGGNPDSIKTRYSYSPGVFKAANYLKERFEEMGLSVAFDTFQTAGFGGNFIHVASSPDGQKAWSVSIYGGIVKTINGGDLWSLISGTDTLELWDIRRVDDDTLWSVGDYGNIFRSTDGGDTWENKSKPEYSSLGFRGCYFEDAHHGWVVGDGNILFTTDAGANWTQQASVPGVRLYGIDFVDPNKGWAVGQDGTILHTTDRGTNWNSQTSPTEARLRRVDFVDSLHGWAVGDGGTAIYTVNGGTNWIQKYLSTSATLNCVDFVDSLHGWIVGYDGTIFSTSDLGANWTSHASGAYYLYGIAFADTLTGWACGYNEIIKTTNRGQSWFSQYKNLEPLDLFNVVATTGGNCYPGRQVLITGHYDDISEDPYNRAPGADDNASGTVSLLASASILKDYNLANTVKFVAFAGEEQGLLGSLAYAEEAYNRGDTILGVLNFDMIAWDGNGDNVLEVHCGTPSQNQALADIFISTLSDYGLSLVAQKITSGATDRSDHASFWAYNYPAILGIEDMNDFNAYYHTTGDLVSVFDTAYYVNFTKAAVAGISILGKPFIIGDANGDRQMNSADVTYVINYLFIGGPVPVPCLQAGDANCDGNVNSADVVYLINYLFVGGPAPGCP